MEFDEARIVKEFFKRIRKEFDIGAHSNLRTIVVSHILPDTMLFLDAINDLIPITYLVPKPNSINQQSLNAISDKYPTLSTSREEINETKRIINVLKKDLKKPFLILDVGGYFASRINDLHQIFGSRFVGVIEDTENGHQKYARSDLPVLVYSVARSKLKDHEDFLIGQAILFSLERILRSNNVLLNYCKTGVIGYGKLGASIASSLFVRNIRTSVCDISNFKKLDALSHGFEVLEKTELLRTCDVIFCATGNKSLDVGDFLNIKAGAFVVSVTSSDDEFDFSVFERRFSKIKAQGEVSLYRSNKNHFYLVNNGNAVNFMDNAVVGPFIYLVQAEILVIIDMIVKSRNTTAKRKKVIEELDGASRQKIAGIWLETFRRNLH